MGLGQNFTHYWGISSTTRMFGTLIPWVSMWQDFTTLHISCHCRSQKEKMTLCLAEGPTCNCIVPGVTGLHIFQALRVYSNPSLIQCCVPVVVMVVILFSSVWVELSKCPRVSRVLVSCCPALLILSWHLSVCIGDRHTSCLRRTFLFHIFSFISTGWFCFKCIQVNIG